MAKMSDMKNDRAKSMDKMSDALEELYATHSPDQQMTFDKVHMSHMAEMK